MARLNTSEAARNLVIETIGGRRTPRIRVESDMFTEGTGIPDANSAYGDGLSPGLRWSEPPSGTRSIALVAEDPDAPQPTPATHWLLYNLPGTATEVPGSIPKNPRLPQFEGAAQGRAWNGTIGYAGPQPPRDDRAHHYHFEVFCLDSSLNLPPGATRSDLMRSMSGHVLAKGELVGLY